MTGYISTRDTATPPAVRNFTDACLTGLASDGGLYVPERYPPISRPERKDSYTETATRVLSALAGEALPIDAAYALCKNAYEDFGHPEVAPLVQIGPHTAILELHHGPSLAFKDIAMRFLAALYDRILSQRGERMTIICATSGDTGGAAAQAFAGNRSVDLIILHPDRRISDVQRLFMTTTGAQNVHNFAIEGDFDACQAIVKALFGEEDFRKRTRLSGVNSINWARIAAQSVYFASAQAALGSRARVQFVVPTGNFGDALAAYVAYRCGLLTTLDCALAVNANKAMEHLLDSGYAPPAKATATLSPAMDIQLPSNFERLLFEATGRNADAVRDCHESSARGDGMRIGETAREAMQTMGFAARSVSDAETLSEIARTCKENGMHICPHTAVARSVARNLTASAARPVVVLATAHAAKFPDTVRQATSVTPALPERCRDMIAGPESVIRLPADTGTVAQEILARSRAAQSH